ncbi:hypothetical protein Hs30E_16640 [Lactococcus hodotermopsidis]|uniref:Uncharacterized protein n=1 Tax=Pseudolactococcus hodotermopsidis TaxID=2709157 RepID=A0A6A0BEI5_9LACT|nr:hypothetical protein [Lactococcus hodotermopsidis]GFH43113.1 hypothetical protein Hs30E_16640 [Lactococcus hodotermopsidis]
MDDVYDDIEMMTHQISSMKQVKMTDSSTYQGMIKINDELTFKMINNLFKKNPSALVGKIMGNKKFFDYVITVLDQLPKGVQDIILEIFVAKENWDEFPKKSALKLLNNPKFALYIDKLPLEFQGQIYEKLVILSSKGWDVLAPIGYISDILSKSSTGAKFIEVGKVSLKLFKELEAVSEFLKKNKLLMEGFSYGADALRVIANAYNEYINPNSPAYGDISKALYGGFNLFLIEAGPLEGAQYGGPVGAAAGIANTMIQGNVTIWPDKIFGFDLPGKEIKTPGIGTEEVKRKWLDELYEQYGKHNAITTDKNYRVGVQSESGSSNFNPETEYKPNTNVGVGNPNQSLYTNWGGK